MGGGASQGATPGCQQRKRPCPPPKLEGPQGASGGMWGLWDVGGWPRAVLRMGQKALYMPLPCWVFTSCHFKCPWCTVGAVDLAGTSFVTGKGVLLTVCVHVLRAGCRS